MKLGRPPMQITERKAKITGVRLSADERSLVERAAANSGDTLSKWLRKTLLEKASVQLNTTPAVADKFDVSALKNSAPN